MCSHVVREVQPSMFTLQLHAPDSHPLVSFKFGVVFFFKAGLVLFTITPLGGDQSLLDLSEMFVGKGKKKWSRTL